MANDPNRDLLPVKEGSCADTCRGHTIDDRDRHAVVNLDRYELEDRYLRMRDEVFDLKKLSNAQEDKIKRLATKLMRASATPGSCLEEALHPDDNRQENLELENAKLKDKIAVLRNQILNTKFGGRSPSRSRRLQICSSSGPATCRSDIGRMRSSTSQLLRASDGDNEKNAKNYVAKIEELEMEKKSLTSRIEDLEIQIASHEAGHQRQKVAENVEFIRVWRQMKLQNDELLASRARNASLEEQICDLKETLEEKSRNVKDATNALLAEQKRMVDMDEQLAKAKISQLTLSEKDERIRELTNEIKILNQHNNELIALSAKCSNAEMENIELRKKHSEQLSDNLSLKSAFSNEQTNIVALQAANQQLMTKLHELQTNVDTLTIQLKALQSQNERQARSSSDRRVLRTMDRQTSTNSSPEKKVPFSGDSIRKEKDVCTRCCQSPRQSVAEKYRPISVSREVQTDEAKLEVRRNSADRAIPKQSPVRIVPRATICDRSFQHDNGNLSAEKMIELLEKAQINTPLDAQNVSRIRRIDSAIAKSCVNASDSRQSWSPSLLNKSSESLVNDPWKILLVLYKILRENVANSSTIFEDNNSCVCDNHCDENNNTRISTDTGQEEYRKNKRNASLRTENNVERRKCDAEQKTARSFSKNCGKGVFKTSWIEDVKNHKTPTNYLVDRCTRMNDCRCEPSEECSYEVDCGQPCVPSISAGELTGIEGRSRDCQCETSRDYFKNFVDDFRSSLQETFDNIHRSRASRVSGASSGLYRSWPRVSESENSAHRSSRARGVLEGEKSDEAVIENFEQCGVIRVKEKVNNYQNEKDLRCMTCRNEICGNGPTVGEIGSSPVLVTNDRGVLEVHMLRLQLTAMATRIICRETKANYPLIFVSCDLCNEERAFRPFLKYPKLNFDSTSIYRVTNLSKFFDRVLERTFCFRIHISRRANTSCPVARAYLSIKDILDYPKNKLYYVVNFSSILPCSRGQDFGQLPIWMRLDCDLEKIETLTKRRGIFRQSSSGKTARQTDSEEKMVCRPSRGFDGRIPSVNVKPDNTRGDTLKGLTPKTRWKSTSTQVEKENAQSSRIGDKRFFSSLQPARISRESQNPRPEQLTAVPDEKKSSTSERSLVNGKSSVITSALTSDSPTSRRVSLVKRSYSSISDEIEAEDTTSEEFRKDDRKRETRYMVKSSLEGNEKLKRDVDDGNTASIDEFNNLIRTGRKEESALGTILSPRKSGSSVQDLGSVFTDDNWRKYRKKSMAVTEKSMGSPISPTGTNERSINSYVHDDRLGRTYDAVVLRIESLALFRRCPFLNDPKIHQVYVEFSFLGYRGVEMETISVPKPAANVKAYFNYMRKFNFDAEKHATQRNIMRDIMAGNESPTIKFVLVSEPVMEEMETKECEEVGYAHFNIRDHILRGHSKDVSLTIMNTEQTEAFGILKITLLGAEAIRRCMSDF